MRSRRSQVLNRSYSSPVIPKWLRPFLKRLAHSFGSPNYCTESSTCFLATVLANRLTYGCAAGPGSRGDQMHPQLEQQPSLFRRAHGWSVPEGCGTRGEDHRRRPFVHDPFQPGGHPSPPASGHFRGPGPRDGPRHHRRGPLRQGVRGELDRSGSRSTAPTPASSRLMPPPGSQACRRRKSSRQRGSTPRRSLPPW